MDVSFTFRDFEGSDGLKEHTLKKFEKLEKFFMKPISAHVILSMDGFQHKAEITINEGGTRYVGLEKTNDMYRSIDLAVDHLANQLKKHKEQVKNHHKH